MRVAKCRAARQLPDSGRSAPGVPAPTTEVTVARARDKVDRETAAPVIPPRDRGDTDRLSARDRIERIAADAREGDVTRNVMEPVRWDEV
jgi:hypothetical protein